MHLAISITYGTPQFKLDRMCMRHGLDMTHFSFYTHMQARHACAHKIDDVKPIIQSFRVCTRRMHDSLQIHTPNLDCMHFGVGQWYKHVHVLYKV